MSLFELWYHYNGGNSNSLVFRATESLKCIQRVVRKNQCNSGRSHSCLGVDCPTNLTVRLGCIGELNPGLRPSLD